MDLMTGIVKKIHAFLVVLSKYEKIWILATLFWASCIYLSRVEFKKFGYTSSDQRQIWIFALICHGILFVLSDIFAVKCLLFEF